MLRQYLKLLADKFREVCPSLDGTISAQDYPDAIQYVYDEAYFEGALSGGGSSDDTKFWDMLTDFETREIYSYAFYCWRLIDSDGKVLFNPKYDIKPTSANSMFEQTKGAIDLHDVFTKSGKELDFSKCTAMNRLFFRSEVAKLGIIDCTSISSLTSSFYYCSNLTEIVEIKFSKDKNYTFGATFSGCNSLTNMTATGSLASSGLDLSVCPLNKASKLSFLNILEPTTTPKSIAFGAGETLTEDEAAIGTQKGWTVTQ